MIQVLWDVTASLGKSFELTVGNANTGPQTRRPSSQTAGIQFET